MNPRNTVLATVLTTTSVLLACSLAGPGTPPTSTPERATPYAAQPAAGICGEAQGDEVVMTLEPGIPDPRCVIVTPGQHLRVVNRTGSAIRIGLGGFVADIAPDDEAVFGTPFAEYLLPGVHLLQADPCCGGELWLTAQ
jgi:hypothetical protein